MASRARWSAAGLGGVLLLASASADAAGLSVARFGGEHGTPMASNATTLYYNPAGIAFSEGMHLFVDATIAWRSTTYQHADAASDWPAGAGQDPDGAAASNVGRATLFNVLGSPMLGVTAAFGDLALGAAFFTPFGGQARWSKNTDWEGNTDYPGAVDGVQRWYTIDGELRSSYVALGAAYRVAPEFSVGLTGNAIISKVTTLRARNVTGDNNVVNEGRSLLDVSGLDFSAGLGVMVRPAGDESLVIGLSYQSRPNFGGHQRLEGTLENNFGAVLSQDDVEFEQDLPDVFRGGVSARVGEAFEVRLFGDYTRWGVMDQQCVVKAGKPCIIDPDTQEGSADVIQNQYRDWNDTFGVRGGLSYFSGPKTELFVGVGYASNAVPDATLEPAIMDFPSFTVGGGARLALGEGLHFAPSYTQVLYVPRDTTGKSEHSSYGSGTVSPDSGGKYKQTIGVISANIDWQF